MNKEKKLTIATMGIGILVGIFMLITILDNQQWAFYIELSLTFPFWTLLGALIVTKIKNKKDKKK